MEGTEKLKRGSILEKIEIAEAVSEGKSIARVDNMVVFIAGGVPGDVADLRIDKVKSNYAEARVVNIHTASPHRVEPFCEHFGSCGGCTWQHMTYEMQLQFKHKQVEDALVRLGKIEVPLMLPIIPSQKTRYYRNRLDFAFSNKRWLTIEEIATNEQFEQNALGFHVPKRFDKILDINTCYLMNDFQNKIRLAIKNICIDQGYLFFDPVKQQGLMRNVVVRNTSTGEWMVVVIFLSDEKDKITFLLTELAARFPQITSLLYIINPKRNDTFYDLPVHVFSGKDHITEEMEGLKFRISAKSFYQTNSEQAYELYKVVREFAALTGEELVYDLYTGTGTIAQFISKKAKKVIGIEQTVDAIEDAKANAKRNGITNTEFIAGDIKDTLTKDFVHLHGSPDVIITDPPRAGMHEQVVNRLNEIRPNRIVYVSCNPATQARDIALLSTFYSVEKVQPVDMFPHTTHVENVALLIRKN
ncbi:MAG: 23S rRNA (uracil(1939)-C(5))-methyltransferase RlmD [Bacteroidota bacterium]